ncbi:hypothetical protein GWI33_013409 [Rhynchophorus ferrugineus]|uniref:C2H2-type domain-containing protein n=1 Tax=Rhynchophorus ferrugineus TaxID=354439 RepID=A0A834I998_RHYFE|nr:hypothetical protein GWI33_013409 [Rhynchophorus ferrugineus]
MAASNETTHEILRCGSSHVINNTIGIKLENINDCDTVEINLDQKLSLADILTQAISYPIQENDGFPPYLCAKCTTCLVDFYNFKLQFERTDIYIRTLLGKNELPQNEYVESTTNVLNKSDTDNASEENVNLNNINLKQEELDLNCTICSLDLKDSDEYDTHMAKLHGQNPFEKYATFRELVNARQKVKTEAERKLKYIKDDLEKEKLLQMPGKLCRFCQKKFPEDEFKFHWELHKKHVCEYCGHKCIKKSDLDVHRQSVHGYERNYICYICNKGFKTKQLLNRHLIVHTNPRSFICHHCGNRFNDKSTLNTHIQLKHIKSRNFICSICGLAFPLKSTLDKHVLRHNKNRPPSFFCNVCNAGFKDNSSLKRHHLMKHTDDYEKPQCQFCKKSYCSKTKLRYHIDRYHSGTKYERKKRCLKRNNLLYNLDGTDEESNDIDDKVENPGNSQSDFLSTYEYTSEVGFYHREKISTENTSESDV